ncbi:MAG: helix-turn-helix domain-containing protein [Verrucomicrobia bacterium]|nr:helix-turn-helix domain-containing protein [Verrucomicrobiota bacterium]
MAGVDRSFERAIKAWRAAMGLSQSQAAEVLGCPVRTLQNWGDQPDPARLDPPAAAPGPVRRGFGTALLAGGAWQTSCATTESGPSEFACGLRTSLIVPEDFCLQPARLTSVRGQVSRAVDLAERRQRSAVAHRVVCPLQDACKPEGILQEMEEELRAPTPQTTTVP